MSESRLSRNREQTPDTIPNAEGRRPFPKMEMDYGPETQAAEQPPPAPSRWWRKTRIALMIFVLIGIMGTSTYLTARHFLVPTKRPTVDELLKEVWPLLQAPK